MQFFCIADRLWVEDFDPDFEEALVRNPETPIAIHAQTLHID